MDVSILQIKKQVQEVTQLAMGTKPRRGRATVETQICLTMEPKLKVIQ